MATNPEDRLSVITIYQGKEIDCVVICETSEDARQLIGNCYDTGRQFVASHAEAYDPEKHLKPVQQKLLG